MTVIPSWINTVAPASYTKLVAMETNAVTGGSVPTNAWKGMFQKMGYLLTKYKNELTTSGSITGYKLSIFLQMLVGYYSLNQVYGMDGTQLANAGIGGIFDVDGFLPAVLPRANNYYDDFSNTTVTGTINLTIASGVITGATGTPSLTGNIWIYVNDTDASPGSGAYLEYSGSGSVINVLAGGTGYHSGTTTAVFIKGTSTKMAADLSTIEGAIGGDMSNLSSVQAAMTSSLALSGYTLTFNDVASIGSPLLKADYTDYIFNDLGWKEAFTMFNLSPYELPDGI